MQCTEVNLSYSPDIVTYTNIRRDFSAFYMYMYLQALYGIGTVMFLESIGYLLCSKRIPVPLSAVYKIKNP